MTDAITHEVWIDAPPETVFAALTTKDGIDAWWGKVITAEPRAGTTVELDHGLGAPMLMEVTDLVPNRTVSWRCVSEFTDPTNPATEWRGHDLTFHIEWCEGIELLGHPHAVTVLRFEQRGWAPDARWRAFCNAAWGQTLHTNLKSHCEEEA
jgi:uncharacterized protein YndB with AHSA1/START domain